PRAGQGQARGRHPRVEHPGRAAGRGGRQERRSSRRQGRRAGLPGVSLLPRGTGDRRAPLLPAAPQGGGRQVRGAVPAHDPVHHRRGVRRLGQGAGGALRRRRHLRPDLRGREVGGAMAASPAGRDEERQGGGGRRRGRTLPGFGLSMGITLTYLTLIILIPLATLFLKTATLTWAQFRDTILAPRTLAAYRLSFGAAFAAAIVNALFGLLVAWVLER